MATLTVNIPDSIAPRVIDAFCIKFSYRSTLEDGSPNPETKQQFTKRKVIEFMKRVVRDIEIEAARNDAAEAAGTSADTDIVLS